MARDNSNPQPKPVATSILRGAQIHPSSNVSLSPLVPRRHEMPPRLRPTFGSLSQTVQASVQNDEPSKEPVLIAAPKPPGAQNASSPNELFVQTIPQSQTQLPGFTAVRARRWENSRLPNVPQSSERRSRLPPNAMQSKKDEIRRKWQEKQAAQSGAARASEEPAQQPSAQAQAETHPNSRGGGDAQRGSMLGSQNEAISLEAAVPLLPPQAFFDQQLTSAISDQFAGFVTLDYATY